MVIALIIDLGHRHVEQPLGPLYLRRYLRKIRDFKRCAVLLDDVHQRHFMKIQFIVFHTEFILRKLKGLTNQVSVLVFHFPNPS